MRDHKRYFKDPMHNLREHVLTTLGYVQGAIDHSAYEEVLSRKVAEALEALITEIDLGGEGDVEAALPSARAALVQWTNWHQDDD